MNKAIVVLLLVLWNDLHVGIYRVGRSSMHAVARILQGFVLNILYMCMKNFFFLVKDGKIELFMIASRI